MTMSNAEVNETGTQTGDYCDDLPDNIAKMEIEKLENFCRKWEALKNDLKEMKTELSRNITASQKLLGCVMNSLGKNEMEDDIIYKDVELYIDKNVCGKSSVKYTENEVSTGKEKSLSPDTNAMKSSTLENEDIKDLTEEHSTGKDFQNRNAHPIESETSLLTLKSSTYLPQLYQEEMASDELLTDEHKSEMSLDIDEKICTTVHLEEDSSPEEISFSTNSVHNHWQRCDEGGFAETDDLGPDQKLEYQLFSDPDSKIEQEEFQRNDPSMEEVEEDDDCTKETFHDTIVCNAETFHESMESFPDVAESPSDVTHECSDPDEDDYFSALDGEDEADLDEIAKAVPTNKMQRKDGSLVISLMKRTVEKCAIKVHDGEGAVNETVPPGAANETVPPGEVNETVPPAAVNETVPPGAVNETVPPGAVNETVPPGVVNETVPPGAVNETVPPGAVNETVLPDKIKFSKKNAAKFHQTKSEAKNVAIQDNSYINSSQEAFSDALLRQDEDGFVKCYRDDENSISTELPMNAHFEATIDSILCTDLKLTSQKDKPKIRRIPKYINETVQLPTDRTTFEDLDESSDIETDCSGHRLHERDKENILCNNASGDTTSSSEVNVKGVLPITNSSVNLKKECNERSFQELHDSSCRYNLYNETRQVLNYSTGTETQPSAEKYQHGNKYGVQQTDCALGQQGEDLDNNAVNGSPFIDDLISTATVCKVHKIRHKRSPNLETEVTIIMKTISGDNCEADVLFIGRFENTVQNPEQIETREAYNHLISEPTKEPNEGRELIYDVKKIINIQQEDCSDISKFQNTSHTDVTSPIALNVLQEMLVSQIQTLQGDSNKMTVMTHSVCNENTINVANYMSDLREFKVPLDISWAVNVLRTLDGNVLSQTSFLPHVIRKRIVCMLPLNELHSKRKQTLDRKNIFKEDRTLGLKSLPEHHLYDQVKDSGNTHMVSEPNYADESPPLPATGEKDKITEPFCKRSKIDFKNEFPLSRHMEGNSSPERNSVNEVTSAICKSLGHIGSRGNLMPDYSQQLQIQYKPGVKGDLEGKLIDHPIVVTTRGDVQTFIQIGDDNTFLQTGLTIGIDDEISEERPFTYRFDNLRELQESYQEAYAPVQKYFKSEPPDRILKDGPNLKNDAKIDVQIVCYIWDPGCGVPIYILDMKLDKHGLLMSEWTEKTSSLHKKDFTGVILNGRTINIDLIGNANKTVSKLLVQVGMANNIGFNQGATAILKERTWLIPWESDCRIPPYNALSTRMTRCWKLRNSPESHLLVDLPSSVPVEISLLGRSYQYYVTFEIKLATSLKQVLFELAVQETANGCACSCLTGPYESLMSGECLDTRQSLSSCQNCYNQALTHKHVQRLARLGDRYESFDAVKFPYSAMNSEFRVFSDDSSYCNVGHNICTFPEQEQSNGCEGRHLSDRPIFEDTRSAIYLDSLDRATKLIVETLHGSESFDKLLDFLGLRVYHVSESGTFVFSSNNLVKVVDKLIDTEQYIFELLFVILEGLELACGICINSHDSFSAEFKIKNWL